MRWITDDLPLWAAGFLSLLCLCQNHISLWAGLCLYSIWRPATEATWKQILKSDIGRDLYRDKKQIKGDIIIQWGYDCVSTMKEFLSLWGGASYPTYISLVKYSTLMGHIASVRNKKIYNNKKIKVKLLDCNLTHIINLSGLIVLFAMSQ